MLVRTYSIHPADIVEAIQNSEAGQLYIARSLSGYTYGQPYPTSFNDCLDIVQEQLLFKS